MLINASHRRICAARDAIKNWEDALEQTDGTPIYTRGQSIEPFGVISQFCSLCLGPGRTALSERPLRIHRWRSARSNSLANHVESLRICLQ